MLDGNHTATPAGAIALQDELAAAASAAVRPTTRGRGWLVRRALLAADVLALATAFAVAFADASAWPLLVAAVCVWAPLAKAKGLYDRDETLAVHSTLDEVLSVFVLVTLLTWVAVATATILGASPELGPMTTFWGIAIALVTVTRLVARALARRSPAYTQRLVIVGAGDIGQLVARKVLQHPEYGLELVGFVDDDPRELRAEVADVPVLGGPGGLPEMVPQLGIDRVVVAFSREPAYRTIQLVRELREQTVQIDAVPRLVDLMCPRSPQHALEGLPLVGLSPVRLSRSSRAVKRGLDIVGASLGLVVLAPAFAIIAILIRRDSPGPVIFRQTRLGLGGLPFTALKFRTMRVDADDREHRDYIREALRGVSKQHNGLYKLERADAITRVGTWLRRTSLDELPQLVNVLRGDMSLVGPRPCVPYETENFSPHHHERFLVPAGVTGLWQVTARANASYAEALEMDVAYARGRSLGLDLRLLAQTPAHLIRQRGTA
jgi:exopolysaccharide biosynthesis polyprenyl glycosylphosphotransferase